MTGTLRIKLPEPLPTAAKFHQSDARVKLLMGGLGCGKTSACIWESCIKAVQHPGNRILHIRKTYASLRNSVIPTFEKCFPRELRVGEINKTEHTQKLINGSVIIFGSMDSEAQRESYRSMELSSIFLHEALEFEEADFIMLFERSRRMGDAMGGQTILESNAPSVRHWMYNRFEKLFKGDPSYAYWKMSSWENKKNLASNYIEDIISQYRGNQDLIKKYIEGDWGSDLSGTPIFSFSDMFHISPDIKYDPSLNLYRGWDLGLVHPAVTWLQVLPDNCINVLRCHVGDREYLDHFSDKIIRLTNQHFPEAKAVDYADVEGTYATANSKKTEFDILRDKGLRPMGKKLPVKLGINVIQNALNTRIGPRMAMVLHKDNCEPLIDAMKFGYCWKKQPDGSITDEPHKDGAHDHPVDSLRYPMTHLFGVNISGRSTGQAPLIKNWQIL